MKRILFQGDSVTDVGRNREDFNDLGNGYAKFSQLMYHAKYPEVAVEFINRGIGGNRTRDLKERIVEDFTDLEPDIVSIMIGINDTWRGFDHNDITTIESYEMDYRFILDTILKSNPKTRFILAEPFVLPYPEDRKLWRDDLNQRIAVVGKLANEYKAELIKYDRIFENAHTHKPATYWTKDGVHPTEAGHILIATYWVKALEKLQLH